ncbi:MAG: germination protein YpeB [Bacillota bacterium]|nr:germination protein YpeB [Bacillota bacterium]
MEMIKKRMFYTVLVTMIVVFSTTYAILMTLERMDYRNYLQGEYSKNLYGLINNLENIDDNLSKSAVASPKGQDAVLLGDIFRHSSSALDKLNSLPVPNEVLQGANKFLSQVGDYCYTLVKAKSEGRDLNAAEYKRIDNLQAQSAGLKQRLNDILMDINMGNVKWGEIRKKVTGVMAVGNETYLSDKFTTVQKQTMDYPSLIYDGPFSDNVLEIKPKVNSLALVKRSDAEAVVRHILSGYKIDKIDLANAGGQPTIDSYTFTVQISGRNKNENITCRISKHGGRLVYLLDNRRYNRPTIDETAATERGAAYLANIGLKDMKATYSLRYEDNIVISFVHFINNVPIYPEQVKLKVALDNGEITGLEAEKFLTAYDPNRKVPVAKISEGAARSAVSSRLAVSSVRLAVIPTETNSEVLAYEFAGTYNNNEFLAYVNAANGNPQKILKILNTPNGRLTI